MASSADWYASIPTLALLLVVFLRFTLIEHIMAGCPAEYQGLGSNTCCMSAASWGLMEWPAAREGHPKATRAICGLGRKASTATTLLTGARVCR